MAISVFELFKIGIGPSSSHTVGPMRAACQFVAQLRSPELLSRIQTIEVHLYGSLGATGIGHGTDKAVLLGLEGETPEHVDVATIDARLTRIRTEATVMVFGRAIPFRESEHLHFHWQPLPYHPNGMRFIAVADNNQEIANQVYYSVGGGFVVREQEILSPAHTPEHSLPYQFTSAAHLLELCQTEHLSISQLMLENEKSWRSSADIQQGLLQIWHVMQQCVANGCKNAGILPGGLNVKRRAPTLYHHLATLPEPVNDPLNVMDWVNLFAIAVNEENAAGGRVVTAPTNGAAGIIPAVLHYYTRFCARAHNDADDAVIQFLLTAGAIGILYKEHASISGADVGCQGEVGVACSMAAAGLTEVLGGTPAQVENAAEIAMEHHLGMTCDPVAGLVQIPCIERNAMGAIKAINATRIALCGDGRHVVSLDNVIKTMRATGADMHSKYKETSRGGLAVNVVEC